MPEHESFHHGLVGGKTEPDDFTPSGEPKQLGRDGKADESGIIPEVAKACDAYGKPKVGPKYSSVTGHGKADIPDDAKVVGAQYNRAYDAPGTSGKSGDE